VVERRRVTQFGQVRDERSLRGEVGELPTAELVDERGRFGEAAAQVLFRLIGHRGVDAVDRDADRDDDDERAREEDPVGQ